MSTVGSAAAAKGTSLLVFLTRMKEKKWGLRIVCALLMLLIADVADSVADGVVGGLVVAVTPESCLFSFAFFSFPAR